MSYDQAEPVVHFSNQVNADGVKFITKTDSDTIEFDMLLEDPKCNGCSGGGSGTVSYSFLKLGEVFEYNNWDVLMNPANAMSFKAVKEGDKLVVNFYATHQSGHSKVIIQCGRYSHDDVKQKVDLVGICKFESELDDNAKRQKLSLDEVFE